MIAFLAFTPIAQSRESATQPTHEEIHRLIEELVSAFPPEYKDGEHQLFGISGSSRAKTPREKDADRVSAARERLTDMRIAAFPDLVAASDDKRFSYSQINAAWCNYSVGDACYFIMEQQIDFYGTGYKSRAGAAGRSGNKPQYLWHIRNDVGLKKWWEEHRARSLKELRIESVKWTIEQETALGFTDDSQRRDILCPLEGWLKMVIANETLP